VVLFVTTYVAKVSLWEAGFNAGCLGPSNLIAGSRNGYQIQLHSIINSMLHSMIKSKFHKGPFRNRFFPHPSTTMSDVLSIISCAQGLWLFQKHNLIDFRLYWNIRPNVPTKTLLIALKILAKTIVPLWTSKLPVI